MSLRQDIHAAIDEQAPSTGGMPERVVDLVARSTRRSPGFTLRFRAPLSFVAVLLSIAVVAGILVGGQILRERNSVHNAAPAGGNVSPLAKVEARPLDLPAVASGAQCPTGPYGPASEIGTGPFHVSRSTLIGQTDWGNYYHDILYSDRYVAGPVIVRASDLQTKEPMIFIGDGATGSIIGSDSVDGQTYQQHLEFLVPNVDEPLGWQFTVGVPWSTSPRCIGWQVDSPGLTEVWVFYEKELVYRPPNR
jgi:hypothetical protein